VLPLSVFHALRISATRITGHSGMSASLPSGNGKVARRTGSETLVSGNAGAARIFALTVVALVAGCTGSGGSGTSAPAVFDNAPDPYHYHCDAACRRGLGG
jgi:hypothetical protein